MKRKTSKHNLSKTLALGVVFFIPLFKTVGQVGTRTEINIPDIPGYVTLKCDFHMHTVFSVSAQ